VTLRDQLSAVLREQLLTELAGISGPDEAAEWARKTLPKKNTLTDPDARQVEDAFRAKLADLAPTEGEPEALTTGEVEAVTADTPAVDRAPQRVPPGFSTSNQRRRQQSGREPYSRKRARTREPDASELTLDGALPFAVTVGEDTQVESPSDARIDKADLTLSEPRRHRDRDHLKFVTLQPCLLCGRRPSDAHHLRFAQSAALGRRVSDEFTVPLCRLHHRALHRRGDEVAWWAEANLEPLPIAQNLWNQTRSTGAGP